MTKLVRATLAELDRLLPMVAAFHEEMGIEQSEEARKRALMPLLEGSPYGEIHLAGPVRAPVGYCILTLGWSVEFGGRDGFIDEIFIRKPVRNRGIGSDILRALPDLAKAAGLIALHLEVDREDTSTRALYEKMRFQPRDRYVLMSRSL